MGPPAIGAFVRSERNWQNVSRQEERKSAGLKPVSLGHRMDKLHPGLKFVKGEKNRTGNNECEKNQCVENGYQDAPFAHGSSRLWQSVYHRMTWPGVKGGGGGLGAGGKSKKTEEMLGEEYVLQGERVVYRIRPKDDKHPVLLPIGETAQFRIHKDKLVLRVAEGADDKEREYIVVSMTPRQDAPAQTASKN